MPAWKLKKFLEDEKAKRAREIEQIKKNFKEKDIKRKMAEKTEIRAAEKEIENAENAAQYPHFIIMTYYDRAKNYELAADLFELALAMYPEAEEFTEFRNGLLMKANSTRGVLLKQFTG